MDDIYWVIIVLCSAVIFAILGYSIGEKREAADVGVFLGFFLGPIGLLATACLDNRPICPNCGGRLNGTPKVCQHCKNRLEWSDGKPKEIAPQEKEQETEIAEQS